MKKIKLLFNSLLLLITGSCTNAQNYTMENTNELFEKIPKSEYDNAMRYYTDKAVDGATVMEVLEKSKIILEKDLAKIAQDKIQYRYGFGKWTVGEVLQHIISYERIMTEKALIIAGLVHADFKYQNYTQASTADGGKEKTKAQLVKEYLEAREATINAFQKLNETQLIKVGTLDGFKTSVRMIALCISGHQVHHFKVLKEKYNIL